VCEIFHIKGKPRMVKVIRHHKLKPLEMEFNEIAVLVDYWESIYDRKICLIYKEKL
jgi:hypothetical protein